MLAFARARRSTLTQLGIAVVLAATCASAALAQDYRRGGGGRDRDHDRQRLRAFHVVVVEYKGPDTAEVVVTDTKQNYREVLRKVMRKGEEARFPALATITRETQERPEIQLRWKVTGPYDAKGAAPAPDDTRKVMTWCGFIEGSDRHTKADVGFQSDGVRGRGC